MRHPAEHCIKYLLVRDPATSDERVWHTMQDWGFLQPEDGYFGRLRAGLDQDRPRDLSPLNRTHRPSMAYLRRNEIYEAFHPNPAMEEAWNILADPEKRFTVEQVILSRLDVRSAASKVNKKQGWFLTADGIQLYRHYFWNPKLLTFDEWGRFLKNRSMMTDRYMALLQGPQSIAFHHLRLEQVIESKDMLRRAQEIAYCALEEVALKPGVGADKVNAIRSLAATVVACHEAQSSSDMALKEVLKQFEKFRMEHPQLPPRDIRQLAPKGNFTGSGILVKDVEPEAVP